jgi:hypothetical protein
MDMGPNKDLISMKENGKMAFGMEKVILNLKMGKLMRENFKMVKPMAKESIRIKL